MSAVAMPQSTGRLRALGVESAHQAPSSFWGSRQETNARATFAHIESWFERMGWLEKFVHPPTGELARGAEFSDSEVYKYLEALSWEAARTGDPAIERRIGELTLLIAARQAPDGYLTTSFGGPGQLPRYTDMAFGHELYCAGHLIQAAVARGVTRGLDDPLVDIAIRLADHVVQEFGQDDPLRRICGHPEIELALAELARLTGDDRYRDQARLFIERRGHRTLPRSSRGWEYFLDDQPVHSATVLRGHAVRALYFTAGVIDVAMDTADTELLDAARRQVQTTHERRTYLTGGMGSRHLDEAFGEDYMLPPDRAYSETCAGVASIMVSWRLLLATGDVVHADAIERALFNVVAEGYGEDGVSFFYANTLHQRRRTTVPDPTSEQLDFGGLTTRAPWYDVSCCLTNLSRLIAQVGTLAVTVTDDAVQLHQWLPGEYRAEIASGAVRLTILGDYPDGGEIAVRVDEAPVGGVPLTIRVPAWADGAVLRRGDRRQNVGPGALALEAATGDVIVLELSMAPRIVVADPRVDAVRGCIAVEQGPRVLCAEFLDGDPFDHDDVVVAPGALPSHRAPGMTTIDVVSHLGESSRAGALRLIPYHAWANRGPSTMRVWLPSRDRGAQ